MTNDNHRSERSREKLSLPKKTPQTQPKKDGTQQSDPKKKAAKETPLVTLLRNAYKNRNRPVTRPKKIGPKGANGQYLSDEERSSLLRTAKAEDIVLAVPPRLLAAFQSPHNDAVKNYAAIRRDVLEFTREALSVHPLLRQAAEQKFFINTDDAPKPEEVLEFIRRFDFAESTSAQLKDLKPKDQRIIRTNAANAVGLWLMAQRSLSLAGMFRLLGNDFWSLEAQEDAKVENQLNTLLSLASVTPLGLVRNIFQEAADEQARIAQQARQETQHLQKKLAELNGELEKANAQIAALEAQNQSLSGQLDAERNRHGDQRSILRDEKEVLRSQVLNRLRDDIRLLDDGLRALRRDPPKIHVMENFAERVISALKSQISELEDHSA